MSGKTGGAALAHRSALPNRLRQAGVRASAWAAWGAAARERCSVPAGRQSTRDAQGRGRRTGALASAMWRGLPQAAQMLQLGNIMQYVTMHAVTQS